MKKCIMILTIATAPLLYSMDPFDEIMDHRREEVNQEQFEAGQQLLKGISEAAQKREFLEEVAMATKQFVHAIGRALEKHSDVKIEHVQKGIEVLDSFFEVQGKGSKALARIALMQNSFNKGCKDSLAQWFKRAKERSPLEKQESVDAFNREKEQVFNALKAGFQGEALESVHQCTEPVSQDDQKAE